jgi:hypothetical protein
VHKGGEEEVVGKEQECLCPVSAFDGADDACCFDGTRSVGGSFESDDFREAGHHEIRVDRRNRGQFTCVGGC